ncbi:MAG TPA: hypothetical protein VJ890_17955 [Vineibacter sp.]|nr:hypothetical protein [Vineibacter sp.]
MSASWPRSKVVEVGCDVDVACTADSLHAHVDLDGAPEIGPGDRVLVHEAPCRVDHGQQIVARRTATIVRASLIERLRTRLLSYRELSELYEIGFSVGRRR